MTSVFYVVSVCLGIVICTRYSKLKKIDKATPVATYQLTNQATTNPVTTIPIANPQTVQTMMVNGQLMQVVTPANQIMNQSSAVMTGTQPQMVIVQGASQQAPQAVATAVVQSAAQPAPVVVGQNDSPPSYQVFKALKYETFIMKVF